MADPVDLLREQVTSLRQTVENLERKAERVVVLVDNTNLNFTIRRMDPTKGYRLCYNKLVKHVTAGRHLRQTRIYYSDMDRCATLSPEDTTKRNEREGFYGFLRYQGYWLKQCSQVVRADGTTKEKGLDAAIVKDIERICQRNVCDTVILVAGDMDYCEVISEAQANYCVKVEVAFFPEYTARHIQQAATKFINLSDVKESLRYSEGIR